MDGDDFPFYFAFSIIVAGVKLISLLFLNSLRTSKQKLGNLNFQAYLYALTAALCVNYTYDNHMCVKTSGLSEDSPCLTFPEINFSSLSTKNRLLWLQIVLIDRNCENGI